ncbi:hypothetical protein BJ741DRAFT_622076 [Chytriomyces cf. hyalinus JEL632]|nr:hypothetical protein BJ741DRAFT_622076 [Chytriomyces cf. hyalinus JEL632]
MSTAPLPIETAPKPHSRSDSGIANMNTTGISQSAARLEDLLHSMHAFSLNNSNNDSNDVSPVTPMSPGDTPSYNNNNNYNNNNINNFHHSSTTPLAVPMHRSRSATRMVAVGCSAPLAELQGSSASLSGYLHKLHAAHEDTWKLRFVLLTQEDGHLYLFKTNSPTALPITFLPLVACSGTLETQLNGETAYMLRVQGDGRTAEGMLVKRTWVLQCPDETTLSLWLRSISRFLDHKNLVARTVAAAAMVAMTSPTVILGTSPLNLHHHAYSSPPSHAFMDQRSLTGPKPFVVARSSSKYSVDSFMTDGSSPPSLYARSSVGGGESLMEAQRMHDLMLLQREAEDRELAEMDARFQREMAEHKAASMQAAAAGLARPKSVASDKSDEKKKANAEKNKQKILAQIAAGYISI